MDRIKANFRRCPLLTVTKKQYDYDSHGNLLKEEQATEFNECYKGFCMAWDTENKTCKVYPDFEIVPEASDEDEDA